MLLTVETSSYNERRYSKPWIARLDFSLSKSRPDHIFGEWLGRPGEEGELTIEVSPGDVVAKGQKDHRKAGKHSEIGVVQLDGSVEWGLTLAAAKDAGELIKSQQSPAEAQYTAEELQSMTESELRAEITRLKAELALLKNCP